MKRRLVRRRLPWALLFVVACGSRTALLVDMPVDGGSKDAGPDVKDGGKDAQDAGKDAPLPPIDSSKPDVPLPNDCPDADATLVYLVSASNDLMSFFPPSLSFKTIGKLSCPNTMGATPFSMGVDRKGAAYVVFTNGNLYRVSTVTAACTTTQFQSGQMGFTTFGMGFAGDNLGEQLYIAQSDSPSLGLATIDTTMMYKFGFVGKFVPDIPRTELTGTGDGRLFGYWPNNDGTPGGSLAQIDRKTAQVTGINALKTGSAQDAFAFAFWGGVFWIFTGTGSTTVTRYDLNNQSEQAVTSTSALIVGAGVSTCAPSQ
jgi:hypothetical protein